jgi:alanyl-tRNA synthetase
MNRYQDAFLFEGTDKIVKLEVREGILLVQFEDTLFYPGGGGQPSDTGSVKSNDFEGLVIEVLKENGRIIHKIRPVHGSLKVGESVLLIINKERRERLVRMHTGEHILYKSLENTVPDITLDKIDLNETESSLFVKAKYLGWEDVLKAELMANQIISDNKKILKVEYSKEEVQNLDKLRIKVERIASDSVRVVSIDGFDLSACTGTHADSTGYVGNILITRLNVTRGSYEIRFKTDVHEELFAFAGIAREAACVLGTDMVSVLPSIKKLKADIDEEKQRYRHLSQRLLEYYSTEVINGVNLVSNIVHDVDKKQLADKALALLKQNTIICFINKMEGKANVLLSASPDLRLDIPSILTVCLSKFGGKGGGREYMAMGSAEERYSDEILKEIKERISSFKKTD